MDRILKLLNVSKICVMIPMLVIGCSRRINSKHININDNICKVNMKSFTFSVHRNNSELAKNIEFASLYTYENSQRYEEAIACYKKVINELNV